jgi:hypothetical protein
MPRQKGAANFVTVAAPEDMDDETFIKHLNARHAPEDFAGLRALTTARLDSAYRTYHERCHNQFEYDHEHCEAE